MDQKIVDAAREFAIDQLSTNLHPQIKFHDLQHTRTVVEESLKIGKAEGVSENNLQLLEVAAWFHDLGYPKQVKGHEIIGAEMARQFLSDYQVTPHEIDTIERIILSTEIQTAPQNHLEKIICDADLAHLGMKSAKERSLLLRKERESMASIAYTDLEWLKTNISFYQKHEYFTESAQLEYGPGKDEHLKHMKEILAHSH